MLFRRDLIEAGYGNGCHAFLVPFDASADLAEGNLVFEIRPTGADAAALRRVVDPNAQTVVVALSEPEALGNIDGCSNDEIFGWIKLPGQGDPVTIDLLVNGKIVAEQVLADAFRNDLKELGYGTGNYAFKVPFNAPDRSAVEIDRSMVVELRCSGASEIVLRRTVAVQYPDRPRTIEPGFIGHVEQAGDDMISGWIKAVDSDAALKINITANGRKVMNGVMADNPREDVVRAGYGTGHYGFSVPFNLDVLGTVSEVIVELRTVDDDRLILQHWSMLSELQTVPEVKDIAPSTEGALPLEAPIESLLSAPVKVVVPLKCKIRLESAENNMLRGWAVDTLDPGRVFDIEVLVNDYVFSTLRNDRPRGDLGKLGISKGLGGIHAEIPFDAFGEGAHKIGLRTPDGQVAMTLIESKGLDMIVPRANEMADLAKVAVIVPVYNAADDLCICVERLAAFTPSDVDILFINDCSPDPRIVDILLDAETRYPNMRVLHNKKNLGFSGTINRGIGETGTADVIMLNSDARVTPRWIDGMWRAAYSDVRIGSVTAMSDRAEAFSAPRAGNNNQLPPGIDEVSFARAFRRVSLGIYPRVPTGNGFCMYVRRACIEEIGLFDHIAFPKGYVRKTIFACERCAVGGTT